MIDSYGMKGAGIRKTFRSLIFFTSIVLFLFQGVIFPAALKGIVKDYKGQPLASINIIVKKTGTMTFSDENGKFMLPVPDNQGIIVLVFKRTGFHPHERRVRVKNQVQVFKIYFIPLEYIQEKISVTAMNREAESVSIPMAENSISSHEIQEKISENIVETLSDTAGIHFIGKGGFSITPSIRGLARRRVLVLVDGTRITSDRRVGSSASFVPPEFARRIEVVRSSASVIYGSDAIGGVVNILTRSPLDSPNKPKQEMNSINLNLNSVNKRINAGILYRLNQGKWDLYTGFQFSRADDYFSSREKILHSGYSYYSGILGLSSTSEKRDFFLDYIGGFGKDIGKPGRENDPDQYSIVPSESNHIIRFSYNEKNLMNKGSLHLSLFLNPTTYILDKIEVKDDTFQRSDTNSFNLGIKSTLKKTLSQALSFQVGMEWFSRQNLKIENRNETGDEIDTSFPIRNGQRNDLGMFLTLNCKATSTIDIDCGIRFTFFSINANVEGATREKSSLSSSSFLSVIKKFNPSLSLFFNIGKALRFPSLSESFYTGITGRRYVVGNPNLEPERSLNIDTGMKISTKNCFIGLYLFAYQINHLIERYRDEYDIYTYGNINRGRILGGEVEVQYSPTKNVQLFSHYFYYKGRSDIDDESLNDIPAPRFFLGGKVFFNRVWFEVNFLRSFKKKDPGPAEVINNAYDILNLKCGCYISSALFLYLKASNLLDKRYFANPDPDIPEAKGINVSAGIHFYF